MTKIETAREAFLESFTGPEREDAYTDTARMENAVRFFRLACEELARELNRSTYAKQSARVTVDAGGGHIHHTGEPLKCTDDTVSNALDSFDGHINGEALAFLYEASKPEVKK